METAFVKFEQNCWGLNVLYGKRSFTLAPDTFQIRWENQHLTSESQRLRAFVSEDWMRYFLLAPGPDSWRSDASKHRWTASSRRNAKSSSPRSSASCIRILKSRSLSGECKARSALSSILHRIDNFMDILWMSYSSFLLSWLRRYPSFNGISPSKMTIWVY